MNFEPGQACYRYGGRRRHVCRRIPEIASRYQILSMKNARNFSELNNSLGLRQKLEAQLQENEQVLMVTWKYILDLPLIRIIGA